MREMPLWYIFRKIWMENCKSLEERRVMDSRTGTKPTLLVRANIKFRALQTHFKTFHACLPAYLPSCLPACVEFIITSMWRIYIESSSLYISSECLNAFMQKVMIRKSFRREIDSTYNTHEHKHEHVYIATHYDIFYTNRSGSSIVHAEP